MTKVLDTLAATLPRTPSGTHPAGMWWWWLQPGYGQKDGPDLIGVVFGRFFAAEAKADSVEGGRPPRPGQVRELEAIALAALPRNAVCVVADEASFKAWRATVIDAYIEGLGRHRTPQQGDAIQRALAVPWRTDAQQRQRPAPPVLRIRNRKSAP